MEPLKKETDAYTNPAKRVRIGVFEYLIGLQYSYLHNKKESKKNQDGEEVLLKFLNEYLNEGLTLSQKYDFSENLQLMKNLKVVKKAYLSRRAGGVSLFKNSNKGASVEIAECLQSLVEKGCIVKLSKDDTLKTFKTTAECFEIKL